MPPSKTRRPSRRARAVQSSHLTSLPTGRAAYAATRAWLLQRHGPICAYCGKHVSARSITLDHVTPRRGQSAYDRRDNLVLACRACNSAKADSAALVFLLADRRRAAQLLRHGDHLSPMLLDVVRQLTGAPEPRAYEMGGDDGDAESPYLEESPYLD